MVRVFGLYLLRSINEELRDLRSLSLYYRLLRSWFSSFSRRYKDKHFSDLSRTGFFELFHLVFGLVFCSLWFLWVWGYWGRERGEVRCDFAQRLFLLSFACCSVFACSAKYHRASSSVGHSESAPSLSWFCTAPLPYVFCLLFCLCLFR